MGQDTQTRLTPALAQQKTGHICTLKRGWLVKVKNVAVPRLIHESNGLLKASSNFSKSRIESIIINSKV
jgi:exosome complex RNA-binding protein Rrp4